MCYSFHNKLKSNPRYLNHHVNRRCDDLIEVLLSMEVDMFFTRKRKEFMSSVTEASAKMEGDRHKASLDIATSRVSTEVLLNIVSYFCHDVYTENRNVSTWCSPVIKKESTT